MDGTTDVVRAAMPSTIAGVVMTVRVVRDSAATARDLVIASADAHSGAEGDGELVGRSLRELVPLGAARLLERIESAEGEAVELRAPGDAPGPGHLLTARPGREGDVWTVTIDPLPEDPAGDARLRELNHRVLNSLAMLSSIIGMESRALNDDAGRAALERVRSRLVAVSNLYRILSAANSRTTIGADVYLRSVADAVAASVGLGERIALSVEAAPCELTTSQAASVGLITNEAMTNAYKHAFPGRRDGRITVALSEQGGALLLCISDNGRGMPDGARSGLGTTLVEALAVDLSGSVSVSCGDWGTSVQVTFPGAD